MLMPWECFCFGTACGAIMFAVATDTTISCSLGRQYVPVLSLSLLNVFYGVYLSTLTMSKSYKTFFGVNLHNLFGSKTVSLLYTIFHSTLKWSTLHKRVNKFLQNLSLPM